ncbi:kh domain containing protein [Stylonychia lemnae]|uniref:Kh domain containing protein n=1 Tax=Stylonychia lemnae TaxID=5949 RepID=A0A077ZUA8_STYLE|nr:kh domain containing protein [Stylonychia lemnae]|eukprot:CDW73457.1 kh domain containing protein [Stylonychia lemnae]
MSTITQHQINEKIFDNRRGGVYDDSTTDNQFIQSLFNQPYMLTNPEMFRFREKIILPQLQGINYVGLIIGPKGTYQKKLEELTGCKILIRGKNSHKEGYPPQPDDHEEQHILILSDTEEKIIRAKDEVQKILRSDEQTRHQIRMQQLSDAQELSKKVYSVPIEDHLLTPYGPPSPHAYIKPVPNECVGLIIGKGGDTIRLIQLKSGARVQVAKKQIPNSTLRNVFIEGSLEKYEKANKLIEEIVEEHRKMHLSYQTLIAGVHPVTPPTGSSSDQYPKQLVDQQNTGRNNQINQGQMNNQMSQMQQQNPLIQMQPVFQPQQNSHMSIEQQRKAFLHHQEQCMQMQKQLEKNPFPGPHTYVSIPNAMTAYIIGFHGEKVKALHQQTGAYIFIPKDHNTLTDERVIQLSGNENSVQLCKNLIKNIIQQMAPHLNIDMDEFKATKQVVEENFKKFMSQQLIKKSEGSQFDENDAQEMLNLIKNEQMLAQGLMDQNQNMLLNNQQNGGGNNMQQQQQYLGMPYQQPMQQMMQDYSQLNNNYYQMAPQQQMQTQYQQPAYNHQIYPNYWQQQHIQQQHQLQPLLMNPNWINHNYGIKTDESQQQQQNQMTQQNLNKMSSLHGNLSESNFKALYAGSPYQSF